MIPLVRQLLPVSAGLALFAGTACGSQVGPAGPSTALSATESTANGSSSIGATPTERGGNGSHAATSATNSSGPSGTHSSPPPPPSTSNGVILGASFHGEIDFGTVLLGHTTEQDLGVLNGRSGDVVIAAIAVSGPGFRLTHNGCDGATLHFHERCVIRISFTPETAGRQRGAVSVQVTAGLPGRASLVGSGSARVPPLPSQIPVPTATAKRTDSPSPGSS